jgi:predicted TIM-barrel fold metal-dependent hydrolase
MEKRQTEGRRHRLSGVPTGRLDIERRLRDMDATSVDVHVLSATPTTYLYDQDASLCAVTSAIQNDQIAKHIAAHPGRFMGIATLPMQAPQRDADEFARAMTKLWPARFHDCVQCRRQKSRRSGS